MTVPRSRLAIPALAFVVLAGCASNGGRITLDRTAEPSTTSVDDGTTSTTDDAGTISWGSCRGVDIAVSADVLSSAQSNGMQCGTLEVPVDHADPKGKTIELAVARLPSKGKGAKRIGSLVVNPGGPGGSGLEFLASSGLAIPSELRAQFDIVSFDPRGIASSTPLDCLTQAQRAELVDTEQPDDPAAVQAEAAATEQQIADGCTNADADLFHHMGTDEVAADLDDIRAGVGDKQLTFLGLSYGTRIAAAYATAFPDNVRAIVLDGSVSPSRDLVESQGGQIKGIVRALDNFVKDCEANADCKIAPDAMGKMSAVADTLEATPLAVQDADGDETLTKDKYLTGVITALYDPSTSMALAEAVAALGGADPARAQVGARFLLDLAGQQSSKEPNGTYGNGFETQGVVNCLDADSPLEGDELAKVREVAGPIPPLLDTDPATDTPSCTLLPTGDGLEVGQSSATDRLLVVGTEGDPATPIEWTHAMVSALGNPALITYGGSGHTASLSRSCVTTQTTEFFLTGKVPATLTDCPKDPDESDIYAQIAIQFETLGLGAKIGKCVADELRKTVDPLGIISLNGDHPDQDAQDAIQSAALACR